MPEAPRALRIVLSALAVTGFSLAASARDETRTRVTIRGSGSDISVERTEVLTMPDKKPELARGNPESPVLSEAIRMKQSGGSDDALLGYLRAHASQIPVVIDLASVNRLRRAGAGRSVLAYLASVAAIEIGDSGAVGGGPAVEPAASPEPEYEQGYAAQYGYPILGGYSAPAGPGRFGPHSFHRPMFRRAPMAMRPVPPAPVRLPPATLERRPLSIRR